MPSAVPERESDQRDHAEHDRQDPRPRLSLEQSPAGDQLQRRHRAEENREESAGQTDDRGIRHTPGERRAEHRPTENGHRRQRAEQPEHDVQPSKDLDVRRHTRLRWEERVGVAAIVRGSKLPSRPHPTSRTPSAA